MSLTPAADGYGPAPERNLKDYWNVIRRRKTVFIQAFVLVMAIGLVVTFLAKPVYRTQATLVVPRVANSVELVDATSAIGALMRQVQGDTINTQLQVLQSTTFMEQAEKRANLTPKPGIMPPAARVELGDMGSDVIRISAEGGDRKDIVTLVNAMIDEHLEQSENNQAGALDSGLKYTREQKDDAERRLKTAEAQLISFRKQHRVVQMTTEQEARTREFVDLQAKLREAQSNVTSTEAQIADLRRRLKDEPIDIENKSQRENPDWAKARDRYEAAKAQFEEQGPNLAVTGDPYLALKKKMDDAKAVLDKTPEERDVVTHTPNPVRSTLQAKLAEMESALQGHKADLNAASARFESRKVLVDEIGPWQVQLTRIERDRESAQAAYDSLSKQLRDLETRQNALTLPVRVLDRPRVPGSPVQPNQRNNVGLTLILALCVAAGMAFLQEYLDDRVNSPDDVERISALPSLGHVPLIDSSQPRLVNSLPANSHVAEAYRALRSSIGFAGIDAPIRRLQVTSASKGEGKTVTSVNLATAMAIDGKKVILVDADLRRPSVHRLLELPNAPGLSEILVGMKTIDEALQETEVENLSVITAGPIPPNPAELLGSRAFDRLVEELETRADVVIFDSPPCMPVTDPLIISARMDGVVLVIHSGHTKKAAIKHVEQLLGRARARIVGCIFNRVEQNKGGYYYQHYYYHYGDGYYSDAANNGDRARRNGRRKPALASGRTTSSSTQVLDDDEEA
jgi:capsular exopolysaccharide synthesis family protein